jgi:hypothetical protein
MSLANTELAFQNEQKCSRVSINNELIFQVKKLKRAAELTAKEKKQSFT